MRVPTDQEKLELLRKWSSGWRPPATRIFLCSICDRSSRGYGTLVGNSAWPVNDGRCCDACDWNVVVPARIKRMEIAMAAEQPPH
jgi:hypothetical protein